MARDCSPCATQVRRVRVADEVEAYLVSLVRATRLHPDIQLGASPRATVALYRAAQATALLDGRSFVLPDDVKAIARPVLAHRLVVDLDQSLRGASADAALAAILTSSPSRRRRSPDRGPAMTGTALLAILMLLAGASPRRPWRRPRDRHPADRGRAGGLGPERPARPPVHAGAVAGTG